MVTLITDTKGKKGYVMESFTVSHVTPWTLQEHGVGVSGMKKSN